MEIRCKRSISLARVGFPENRIWFLLDFPKDCACCHPVGGSYPHCSAVICVYRTTIQQVPNNPPISWTNSQSGQKDPQIHPRHQKQSRSRSSSYCQSEFYICQCYSGFNRLNAAVKITERSAKKPAESKRSWRPHNSEIASLNLRRRMRQSLLATEGHPIYGLLQVKIEDLH
jgi:hypothetical protein